MNNLIRIFSLSLILISSIQINAQTFGIHAGVDFLDPIQSNGLSDIEFSFNPMFKMGPTMDVQLNKKLDFTTGLWLGYQTQKIGFDGSQTFIRSQSFTSEIPVLIRLSNKEKKYRLFGQIGASVSSEILSSFTIKDSFENYKTRSAFSWFQLLSQLGIGVESDVFRIGLDVKVPMLAVYSGERLPVKGTEFIGLSGVYKFGKPKR